MSRSNPEGRPRLPRRNRAQSIDMSSSNGSKKDTFDPHHYTELVLDRMHHAWLTAESTERIIGRQVRHVNNHQHPIAFRQQFIEQIGKDIEEIDRLVGAEYRKYQEQEDKRQAALYRNLEETYQRKSRDLDLYNNRKLVKEMLKDHLKKKTPQGQEKRIEELEEELSRMKDLYEKLLKRVEENEVKQETDKREHDRQMNEMTVNFQNYRDEMENYKKNVAKEFNQLREELEKLRKEQERLKKQQLEHGTAIKDLQSYGEKIEILSKQLDELIKQYRLQQAKFNEFNQQLSNLTTKFDLLGNRFDSIEERFVSIEEDIRRIRSSLIDPNRILQLELDQQKINAEISRLDQLSQQYIDQLAQLRTLYYEILKRIDSIQPTDLTGIHSELARLDRTLSEHRAKLEDLDAQVLALSTNTEEMKRSFDELQSKMNDLEAKLFEIENQLNNLPKPEFDTEGLQEQLAQLIGSVRESLNEMQQTLDNRIKDAQNSIETLRKLIDEMLRKKEDPPAKPAIVEKQSKRILVKEPLPPRDLLDDIWTK